MRSRLKAVVGLGDGERPDDVTSVPTRLLTLNIGSIALQVDFFAGCWIVRQPSERTFVTCQPAGLPAYKWDERRRHA